MSPDKVKLNKTNSESFLFSKEEILNISALGNILRQIRARLKHDGILIDETKKNLAKSNQHKSKTKLKGSYV